MIIMMNIFTYILYKKSIIKIYILEIFNIELLINKDIKYYFISN